jgi:hypothetical protein
MCNFIIRPIKCYATVDVNDDDSGSANPIVAGEAFTVKSVTNGLVVLVREDDALVNVPLEVYVHTFSDKDPNKKEKKDSKESK